MRGFKSLLLRAPAGNPVAHVDLTPPQRELAEPNDPIDAPSRHTDLTTPRGECRLYTALPGLTLHRPDAARPGPHRRIAAGLTLHKPTAARPDSWRDKTSYECQLLRTC